MTSLRREQPDLLFLDVQMPEVDGFDVLAQVGAERMPVTVFVTAYDHYAIRAFDACALDYLLKPFSDERFAAALDRARAAITSQERSALTDRLARVLGGLRDTRGAFAERLMVKTGTRSVVVDVKDIDWIEAAGVYVRVHTGDRTHVHRESIGTLAERLDPRRFVRIHRSFVVAVDRIREITHADGQLHVVLKDDSRLKLSRSYRERLEECLGQRL